MKIKREDIMSSVSGNVIYYAHPFGCSNTMGFGAAYLHFVNNLYKCLDRGIGFRFVKIKNPKGFVIDKGWGDYFLPFCEDASGWGVEQLNRSMFPYNSKVPWIKDLARFWLNQVTHPKTTFFAFDDLSKMGSDRCCFQWPSDNYLINRGLLISALWVYNEMTEKEVREIVETVPISGDYVAIALRRGDKITEFPYVSVEQYYNRIVENYSGDKTMFLATDDYEMLSVVKEVFHDWHVISLTEKTWKGYIHSEFRSMSASERKARTVRFFAQFELMKNASCFFGSKTTNVSHLVNAFNGGERVFWVD